MNLWSFLSMLLVTTTSVGQSSETLELFWNLYSAVVRGSRILHDITEGVGAVSKAIRAIDNLLDLGPPEETDEEQKNVDLTGPVEAVTAVEANGAPETPSVFNECGALGFHIRDQNLPVGKMTQCCVAHDGCYEASCKVNKKDCDSKLRSCLFSKCDNKTMDKSLQKICVSAAQLLFSGKMALSFQEFNGAQQRQFCKPNE